MITVKATREGLIGQKTASGYVIDHFVPFVALPSGAALRLWVLVTNPLNGQTVRALVLDVGPHYTDDHAYVFGEARPRAESGVKADGTPMNGAGIDLSERVWIALGMTDNTSVEWEFA